MKRRSLLKILAGALALDPERALWVPGAKTISIPKPSVIVTPGEITAATLRLLRDHSRLFNPSNDLAQLYRTGRIGDIINVRTPPRFIGRSGRDYRLESITEKTAQVILQGAAK